MDEALQSGPWLMGEMYTLVDIVVTPTIDRMNDLRMSAMWEDRYPLMTDWYCRMQGWPAFAGVYAKGARLSERIKIKDRAVELPRAG